MDGFAGYVGSQSGTAVICERSQREHFFDLLQNLGCIGSSLIEKQRHAFWNV